MARSYWISHDQARAANADDGIPLAMARVIQPDAPEREVELAPALADAQDLASLRVLWVRDAGDATGMADAMGRVELSLRRLIPQHGLEPTFTELLVPRTLRDLEIPVPPADWQQFVVEPMDRPSPGASDSFWDNSTPPRQGLHAALIVGGILGGTNFAQPAPRDAKADAPWVIHPFSRVVRGADRARRETSMVLRERLAMISAADVAPDQFFAPDTPEGSAYVDDAAKWELDLDDEALRFRRPEIRFGRRRQSFLEFLLEVLRFLRWALKGMFGLQRWSEMVLTIRARIARRLEADDYGATIDGDAPTPRGLDLKDYDEAEAEARSRAVVRITAAARADGRLPDRSVWESVARLVPSLIDGTPAPLGWIPRTRFDHTFVLPPRDVVRSESPVLEYGEGGAAGSAANDELRAVRRIGAQELAQAIRLALSGLEQDLARIESPTDRVAKTAQAIADQAHAEAAEQRAMFAQSLRGSSPGADAHSDAPLLSRIRASLVSDLVLARLAAEYLSRMTPTAIPNTLAKFRKMLRDGTWMVLAAVLIGVGATAFLVGFSTQIDAVFAAMQISYPTSWTQLAWLIGVVIVGVLLDVFARLFYAYHAYNEVGRRRLEYVEQRAAAAVAAYDERNRLRNAERIFSAWEDILSSLGTRDEEATPALVEVPGDLPDALQVAEPEIESHDLERLVLKDAIEPGWFGDALQALLTDVLNKNERERLWGDPGLPGAPLARLRESAVEGSFQRTWWDAWITRTADRVAAKLADEARAVRPLATRRNDILTAKAFQTEITRPLWPEYQPGNDYEELFDASEGGRRLTARARQATRGFQLTPALIAADTVLVFRRLGRLADGHHDDSDRHDDNEIGRA